MREVGLGLVHQDCGETKEEASVEEPRAQPADSPEQSPRPPAGGGIKGNENFLNDTGPVSFPLDYENDATPAMAILKSEPSISLATQTPRPHRPS